jgi:hypothetical protein
MVCALYCFINPRAYLRRLVVLYDLLLRIFKACAKEHKPNFLGERRIIEISE